MGLLRKIAREWDPRHDFDRVKNLGELFDPQKLRNRSLTGASVDITYLIANGLIKHALRYGAPAAGLGALIYHAAGKDPNTGADFGFWVVGGIDSGQYTLRGAIIPTVKIIDRNLKNVYAFIRNSLRQTSNNNPSN